MGTPGARERASEWGQAGFTLVATRGTYQYLKAKGISINPINKVSEGRPHIEDALKSGQIALMINTPGGKRAQQDSYSLRRTALVYNVPYFTTMAGAQAAVQAIKALQEKELQVKPLQEYHAQM